MQLPTDFISGYIMAFEGKNYSNCVAIIGLFSFVLCLGMLMYDNDFETEENNLKLNQG